MRMNFLHGHLRQEVDRLICRRHAVRHMRLEERRVIRRDDELGIAEQIERSTARHPVHRHDHRLPQIALLRAGQASDVIHHERQNALARRVAGQRLAAPRLGNVKPGAERPLPSPGEHDDTHRFVPTEVGPQLAQLELHG
jgi:hypothetical protein